jgi:hypothetical protein
MHEFLLAVAPTLSHGRCVTFGNPVQLSLLVFRGHLNDYVQLRLKLHPMSEFEGGRLAAETAGEELRAGRIVIFYDAQDLESLGDELTAEEGSIFLYKETLKAGFGLLFLWLVV